MTDATGPATRWWWVRHAPVRGHEGRLYGSMDVDCDTSDTEAIRVLAARLPDDAVWVTSPLKRTAQTMAAICTATRTAVSEPIVEPDLAEQDFGRWQGLKWTDMQAADPKGYHTFWTDPTRSAPPGGESFAHLIARTRAVIERLTANHASQDIVSISHGGTIRAAVAVALGLDPAAAMVIAVDNLSLTRLDHVAAGLLRGHGGVWRVEGVNIPALDS